MGKQHFYVWFQKHIGKLFIAFVLFVIIAPFLFTRFQIHFDETGQIGDTIGGITAPIINTFAALLVYFAFKAQVEANKVQSKALVEERERTKNEQAFNSAINELDWCADEYERLSFNDRYGADAMIELITHYKNGSIDKTEITVSLIRVSFVTSHLKEIAKLIDNIGEKKYKAVLASKFLFIYQMKVLMIISAFSNVSELIENDAQIRRYLENMKLEGRLIIKLEKCKSLLYR